MLFGGFFDYPTKQRRLAEVSRECEDPQLWTDPEKAQKLSQEKSQLEDIVHLIDHLEEQIHTSAELLELAAADDDHSLVTELANDVIKAKQHIETLEFKRMFSGDHDACNCYLEIQSGSGGTEAQDWAEMLLRMYLRWCDQHGFQKEILEVSPGDVAGIKGATIAIKGEYVFGWLRTETGVHRLVRKSPFDSGNRRHTSFAAVFVSPEIDDNIEIDINPADLRVDTYRASGAGGQHVNKTDSAIRITHEPTGVVVQCQNERSQHKNRAQAMKQLRSKLYELELQKQNQAKQAMEDSKSDIGWGNQIRSYVLDDSRIKDLRTGVEVSHTQKVLDGDLDKFMIASLKQGY